MSARAFWLALNVSAVGALAGIWAVLRWRK